MRTEEKIQIPEGIECSYKNDILKCNKGQLELSKKIQISGISILIKDNAILFNSKKPTKREKKITNSFIKHIKNMLQGLNQKFEYKLETANIHFPMSLKLEEDKISISNFLGEKVPRYAKVLPGVKVEIKGNQITVSSSSKEAAGQTAANIEKAARVNNRDRRIFQDGIYITEKPGDKK